MIHPGIDFGNVDVRYANSAKLDRLDVLYRITANDDPTVRTSGARRRMDVPLRDLDNRPRLPRTQSSTARWRARVRGAGGYVFLDDALYLEATAYEHLDPGAQTHWGVDPLVHPDFCEPVALLARAFEPHIRTTGSRSARSACSSGDHGLIHRG